jgi:hypothetical protein
MFNNPSPVPFLGVQLDVQVCTTINERFAALREDFCHHQNLSIVDGNQALLISGKDDSDDERYMKVLTDVLNMQAHHIHVPEALSLKTALAQTIPNVIAVQMGSHFTVRRYKPDMEWFRMPHAKAFRIY